jgi:hypothetical protein
VDGESSKSRYNVDHSAGVERAIALQDEHRVERSIGIEGCDVENMCALRPSFTSVGRQWAKISDMISAGTASMEIADFDERGAILRRSTRTINVLMEKRSRIYLSLFRVGAQQFLSVKFDCDGEKMNWRGFAQGWLHRHQPLAIIDSDATATLSVLPPISLSVGWRGVNPVYRVRTSRRRLGVASSISLEFFPLHIAVRSTTALCIPKGKSRLLSERPVGSPS